MRHMPDGSIEDLPIVKPATCNPRDFHDSLMQRTVLTKDEKELLIKVLDVRIAEGARLG